MNTNTLDKLRKLKFFGMFHAFKSSLETGKTNDYTADELLAHLVDIEWEYRQNRRIDRQLLYARFRYKASVEEIHYHADRSIDRNQVMRLADCTFIDRNENLLITGSTGIGKSYVASAIGHQACMLGYKVFYASTPKLFAKLKMAKADGSYMKEVTRIERQQLLILDDFGIQPFDAQNRAALMEIIEDRHGKTSLIITSQLPVSKWHEVIGEKTIADAILDRHGIGWSVSPEYTSCSHTNTICYSFILIGISAYILVLKYRIKQAQKGSKLLVSNPCN